jgi:hypothetical protein
MGRLNNLLTVGIHGGGILREEERPGWSSWRGVVQSFGVVIGMTNIQHIINSPWP